MVLAGYPLEAPDLPCPQDLGFLGAMFFSSRVTLEGTQPPGSGNLGLCQEQTEGALREWDRPAFYDSQSAGRAGERKRVRPCACV